MQSIEAFLFIGGPVRIFLFIHRPFHRAVEMVPSPLQRLYQTPDVMRSSRSPEPHYLECLAEEMF